MKTSQVKIVLCIVVSSLSSFLCAQSDDGFVPQQQIQNEGSTQSGKAKKSAHPVPTIKIVPQSEMNDSAEDTELQKRPDWLEFEDVDKW